MDLFILVNAFEDVRGSRAIGEFQLLKRFLSNLGFITFFEVFYWHLAQHMAHFNIGILKHKMSLHVLLLKQSYKGFVL